MTHALVSLRLVCSFLVISFLSCVWDKAEYIGKVVNTSTRNIVVKMENRSSIDDRSLFLSGGECYAKAFSTTDFYLPGIPDNSKREIWYFNIFDEDSLKKYFFNEKIPTDRIKDVTSKAFLKRVSITRKEVYTKTVNLVY